jgi:Mg2+ and Co2+ transporter CorA
MQTEIQYIGKIQFEPEHITKKHEEHGEWKKVAMLVIPGEVTAYYKWFLAKNYGVKLMSPLRGAHVTFINDRFAKITGETEAEKQALWDATKLKWDGKEIPVNIDMNIRTDSKWWWYNVSKEHREEIQAIRDELGIGEPFYGLHMTVGQANEKNIPHSDYIHRLLIFNDKQNE